MNKTLKITFLFTLLILSVSNSIFAAKDLSTFKNDISIDGKNKEWTSPLPRFDKNTSINYSVANDLDKFYFIIRIADTTIIKQINKYGFEVWINKDGKKKRTTGITFPLAGKNKAINPIDIMTGDIETINTGSLKKNDKEISNLKLTGFLIDNGEQPVEKCPVKVALTYEDSGTLIYEVAVPFNTFYKEKLENEDAANKFRIGFVVKEAESSDDQMGGPGRMMGYGMMMGGPGGMGGSGSMMRVMQAIAAEKEYWFTVTPSVK
jgi:hypothetical protein